MGDKEVAEAQVKVLETTLGELIHTLSQIALEDHDEEEGYELVWATLQTILREKAL